MNFYFIEKDEYFSREFLYGTASGDYPDNASRFAFFSNAVLESIASLGFIPDIIHCNDWQTALIAFYLKYKFQDRGAFNKIKTLFSIHNLAYQGLFSPEVMPDIGVEAEFFKSAALEFYGKFSFIKAGILYSDAINTVSKAYAKEILTPEFGCGLDGLLTTRKADLYGIINGADYSQWNPQSDKFIKINYNEKNLADKSKCKQDLLEEVGLGDDDGPLLGVVSRLAEQKGIDIIASALPEMVKLGCRLVILGLGEEKYHLLLTEMAGKYPRNLAVKIAFDNPLAHKIEAGADMFLMPSRYEPCGLNQMYSLKYGTIPVVRAVGGLDDVVIDYSQDVKTGNGFKFKNADPQSLITALNRAISVYNNRKEWLALMARAVKFDFSWERSAEEYINLYRKIVKTK